VKKRTVDIEQTNYKFFKAGKGAGRSTGMREWISKGIWVYIWR